MPGLEEICVLPRREQGWEWRGREAWLQAPHEQVKALPVGPQVLAATRWATVLVALPPLHRRVSRAIHLQAQALSHRGVLARAPLERLGVELVQQGEVLALEELARGEARA